MDTESFESRIQATDKQFKAEKDPLELVPVKPLTVLASLKEIVAVTNSH